MDRSGETEFKLLGPLEVYGEHGRVALGPPQQRALVALLLLNANQVVSRDRLIDAGVGIGAMAIASRRRGALRKLRTPVTSS